GTPLTCRPAGQFGRQWNGTAVGVIPAPAAGSGWLQVVRRDDGSQEAVHPALIAPDLASPYAWISFRNQRRFSEFDPAEAAGHDAARLEASLVDAGDQVRLEVLPKSGHLEIREVTGVETSGAKVTITTRGLGGDTRDHTFAIRDRVEVLLPA